MRFLLDTNVCIAVLRNRPERVADRVEEHKIFDLGVSSITVAELRYGAEKSPRKVRNHEALSDFLIPFTVCSFDTEAAEVYGVIRRELEAAGTPIGSFDLLIAAHALSLDLTVVTHNVSEFSRVRGLKIEDWFVESES